MRELTLSEQQLQEQLVTLLNSYGRPDIASWCCPNGARLGSWKIKKALKAMGVRKGASDLMFVIDGKFHGVELKTEIGTLSDDQHDFREMIERAGGYYHSAFGLDEAVGVLQGIKAFRANVRIQIASEGASPGQSTLAAASSPRLAASVRGRPSPEQQPTTLAADGLRVRKGGASGQASRSPNSLAGAGRV